MWGRLKCFVFGCVLPKVGVRGERAACSRCGRRHFADRREGRLEWLPFGMLQKGGVGTCVPPEPGAEIPPVPHGVHWQRGAWESMVGPPMPRPRPRPRPKLV